MPKNRLHDLDSLAVSQTSSIIPAPIPTPAGISAARKNAGTVAITPRQKMKTPQGGSVSRSAAKLLPAATATQSSMVSATDLAARLSAHNEINYVEVYRRLISIPVVKFSGVRFVCFLSYSLNS